MKIAHTVTYSASDVRSIIEEHARASLGKTTEAKGSTTSFVLSEDKSTLDAVTVSFNVDTTPLKATTAKGNPSK